MRKTALEMAGLPSDQTVPRQERDDPSPSILQLASIDRHMGRCRRCADILSDGLLTTKNVT